MDNLGIQTLTSTHNPGDSFPIGTTTVNYTSIDAAGNSATCTFNVVVSGKLLLERHANAGFLAGGTCMHQFPTFEEEMLCPCLSL